MRLRIPASSDDSGQALVELALVLPLVLLLLFGIIDFGLAINQSNSDTNLANVAAREVAVMGTATTAPCNGTSESSLQAWVQCEAAATGAPTPSTVCVADTAGASPSGTYTAGDPVEVKLTSTFSWMKLITGGDGNIAGVNPSSTLSASATMRLEQAPTGGTSSFLQPTCTS